MNYRNSIPLLLLLGAGCAGEDLPDPAPTAGTLAASAPALAIESLDSACPASRQDALCGALRDGAYPEAGRLIAARVAAEPRTQVLADPAVRWWVRERSMALLTWHAVADGTSAFLSEYFPAYSSAAFPIARAPYAPAVATESCARPTEAIILFVGVLRSANHQEFDRQSAALRDAFPCLRIARVEYDSFVATGPNAALARQLIAQIDAELGPVPLHFIGYSQGVSNALRTLADYPDVAARVRTMVALNSAAHGSEVADALLAAVSLVDREGATCEDLPAFAREACRFVDTHQDHPIPDFLKSGLIGLGFDARNLDETTIGAFLRVRIEGLRSLGTVETAKFWRERGAQLPRTTLYLSFRSFIGDTDRNLPASSGWSYLLINGLAVDQRENDMQVRLVNQALGGPIASVEVVGPAAEGNHWQWELTSNDLSEQLEPKEMAERMPHEALLLAYYETLHEIGLVQPGR